MWQLDAMPTEQRETRNWSRINTEPRSLFSMTFTPGQWLIFQCLFHISQMTPMPLFSPVVLHTLVLGNWTAAFSFIWRADGSYALVNCKSGLSKPFFFSSHCAIYFILRWLAQLLYGFVCFFFLPQASINKNKLDNHQLSWETFYFDS